MSKGTLETTLDEIAALRAASLIDAIELKQLHNPNRDYKYEIGTAKRNAEAEKLRAEISESREEKTREERERLEIKEFLHRREQHNLRVESYNSRISQFYNNHEVFISKLKDPAYEITTKQEVEQLGDFMIQIEKLQQEEAGLRSESVLLDPPLDFTSPKVLENAQQYVSNGEIPLAAASQEKKDQPQINSIDLGTVIHSQRRCHEVVATKPELIKENHKDYILSGALAYKALNYVYQNASGTALTAEAINRMSDEELAALYKKASAEFGLNLSDIKCCRDHIPKLEKALESRGVDISAELSSADEMAAGEALKSRVELIAEANIGLFKDPNHIEGVCPLNVPTTPSIQDNEPNILPA